MSASALNTCYYYIPDSINGKRGGLCCIIEHTPHITVYVLNCINITAPSLYQDTHKMLFWIILVSSLGFFQILNKLCSLARWIFNLVVRPAKDLTSYGSWALVTGSTDGIGKAFAFKLAANGLNLVLVSRNSAKLKTVSAEIQARFPDSKIKLFELDFSRDDVVSRVAEMREAIEGLDIGVLINNVGVTYPRAMYFHEVEEKVWMNLVRVNVEGTTHVTGAVVAGMIRRGRGAVLNIGSGASVVVPSHPLYAVYAATKA